MTTRENARDRPASERRERATDDEIERLFGSLPHVRVSRVSKVRGDEADDDEDEL